VKNFFGIVGAFFIALMALTAVIAVPWMIMGQDLALQSFFAPRQEAVRRSTFEQSKAYQEGMAQEVRAMQMEYVQASPEHKDALASVILHRVADCEDQLPSDLRSFVGSLKSEKSF
jgi:hypothetical protein